MTTTLIEPVQTELIATDWKDFAMCRPRARGMYMWRIPEKKYGGVLLRPEIKEKVVLVGMGHAENELWPLFSHWDGYRRTVPKGTEWREVLETDLDVNWNATFELCPFCFRQPRLEWSCEWIPRTAFDATSFRIVCRCGLAGTQWNEDLDHLVNRWNTRKAAE